MRRHNAPGATPNASATRPIVSRSTLVARPLTMLRAVLTSTPARSASWRGVHPFRATSSSTLHFTATVTSYQIGSMWSNRISAAYLPDICAKTRHA